MPVYAKADKGVGKKPELSVEFSWMMATILTIDIRYDIYYTCKDNGVVYRNMSTFCS